MRAALDPAVALGMEAPMLVPLQRRRGPYQALLGKVQHVIAGVPLMAEGIDHLRAGGEDRALGAIEVVVAAFVLGVFLRDLRQARSALRARRDGHPDHGHAAMEWFDLAAGAMLILEAWRRSHAGVEGGRPMWMRATFLTGVVTIAIGLLHGRLAERRRRRFALMLDADGVRGRVAPWRRLDVRWASVRALRRTPDRVELDTREGRRVLALARCGNRESVVRALAAHARAAGVPVTGEAAAPGR